MKRTLALTLAAGCVVASAAHANFTVTGRFQYQDRAFGPNGFTNSNPANDPHLPIASQSTGERLRRSMTSTLAPVASSSALAATRVRCTTAP